jgi:hypothetical protein
LKGKSKKGRAYKGRKRAKMVFTIEEGHQGRTSRKEHQGRKDIKEGWVNKEGKKYQGRKEGRISRKVIKEGYQGMNKGRKVKEGVEREEGT